MYILNRYSERIDKQFRDAYGRLRVEVKDENDREPRAAVPMPEEETNDYAIL